MSNRTRCPDRVMLRIVLYPGELYRLPQSGRGIRVCNGKAWATCAGKDIIVTPGETAQIAPGTDAVLVSAVGHAPMVLEVLGAGNTISSSITTPVLNPMLCDR
jgi:hypothetical protein